jgi:hypothetical protein
MLLPRLIKRFIFALVASVLVLVMVVGGLRVSPWLMALSLPAAGIITFLYWRSFSGSMVCPRCNGTGKYMKQRGREFVEEYCPSCDGEGRVPRPERRW